MRTKSLFLVITILLTSCISHKTLTPTEIKIMTTKQYEENYDLVFSSALSLIQSEGFLITNTDKSTGLINANKQIDNKNAGWQMALVGTAKEASTAQLTFFIQQLNDHLTEVKMTIYEGSVTSSTGSWGIKNTSTKNNMVEDAEVYATWFNNLGAEIGRRKALLE